MKKLKNKKGFTLIELIVVVAILGILALILVPSFMGYADDAKKAVNQANARNVWVAAKAAEAKSEYDDTYDVKTYAADGVASDFRTEVEEKLGDSFTGKTAVDVATGKVTKVTYVISTGDDGEVCSYDGKEQGVGTGFTGACE